LYGINEFDATALQMHAEKSSAPDFDFIKAIAGDEVVFNVRGDGLAYFNQLTIANGGLKIVNDGLTVLGDGMNVFSSSTSTPVVAIKSTATSARGAPVLLLSSATSSPASNYLLRAQNQGTTRFTIRSDGFTHIYSGGLSIAGGLTMQTGGFYVTGGLSVLSGGLLVLTGGITVYNGGLYVSASGASIKDGGLLVNNGNIVVAVLIRPNNNLQVVLLLHLEESLLISMRQLPTEAS